MSDTPETDYVENNLGNCAHPVLSSFFHKLERERDEARELAANLEISLTAAIRSANARQDETKHAMAERDEAVRSCHIWQQGHSKIVEDRDYWRAEAERWRQIKK